MIRGTTPTHIFRLQVETAAIKELRITYEQYGRVVVEKTETEVLMESKEIRLKLTQEETLAFRPNVSVQLQLKILTKDNSVLACPIMDIPVEEILSEEVLE